MPKVLMTMTSRRTGEILRQASAEKIAVANDLGDVVTIQVPDDDGKTWDNIMRPDVAVTFTVEE